MAAWGVIAQPLAARTPAVATQEVRGDAGLVNEDVGTRVVERLRVLPPPTCRGDVRPALFVGVYGFLTVRPRRSIVRQRVLRAARVGKACCNSASVASDGP
jgi:hypothetical protein